MYPNYSSVQPRLDSLMQQRQFLDQQINALSQYQMPPININNNMTPAPQGNFDFNGKWVTSESEAKGVANNNLPLILFDKNEPVFYMKNLDGSFKKYKFMEVVEQVPVNESSRIDALESKINAVIEALNSQQPTNPRKAGGQEKAVKKEGVNNE